ncbi:leucine-rich repeat domain-containing protein [Anaerolinea sp.]|uniref:leucine-rich repeat domain-containing protein n=1 Tax=Anaerolinea sp. TaxID=1872519 RepID=UPI002ACEECF5|nr:leucine-rich repeat domain-containing protein [Anaerolinea sp.]
MQTQPSEIVFSSTQEVVVYTRPRGNPTADWQELDRGPGIFRIPAGHEVMIRLKNIDNDDLKTLVRETAECPAITFLHLAENRKITDEGVQILQAFRNLSGLNLSSCDLTDQGLKALSAFPRLSHLNLSFCNRLTDAGLKHLRALPNLTYLDLQGCLKITHGGIARLGKRDLNIHR